MLLIDGAKYLETPPKDEDELEKMVEEHAQDIFGEDSLYFDKKYKLKSLAGVGSIPDGFAITFGSAQQWHIVEVELSSHDPYSHVTPQIDKFLNGINNQNTINGLINELYSIINNNVFYKQRLKDALGSREIHDYLSQLIHNSPIITVIIEKENSVLIEALKRYPKKKIVEFRTFKRENAEAVHAHLFEPINPINQLSSTKVQSVNSAMRELVNEPVLKRNNLGVSLNELLAAKIIHVNQEIYGEYKGITYKGKILVNGRVWVNELNKEFNSLSGAAVELKKGQSEDGWRWWFIFDDSGEKVPLSSFREKLNQSKL